MASLIVQLSLAYGKAFLQLVAVCEEQKFEGNLGISLRASGHVGTVFVTDVSCYRSLIAANWRPFRVFIKNNFRFWWFFVFFSPSLDTPITWH